MEATVPVYDRRDDELLELMMAFQFGGLHYVQLKEVCTVLAWDYRRLLRRFKDAYLGEYSFKDMNGYDIAIDDVPSWNPEEVLMPLRWALTAIYAVGLKANGIEIFYQGEDKMFRFLSHDPQALGGSDITLFYEVMGIHFTPSL